MGVNWVSLAPDSVGWLFGPWASWAADGDCKSSRIGKVTVPAGVGGVPGLLLLGQCVLGNLFDWRARRFAGCAGVRADRRRGEYPYGWI